MTISRRGRGRSPEESDTKAGTPSIRADVIVIGGGIGGLMVALTLAEEQYRVIVLERQSSPGGSIQTIRRGRFAMNTGLYHIGGLEQDGVLRDAFGHLGLTHLPWRRMDMDCFEEIHQGGRIYRLPQGIKAFVNCMKEYFPREERGLDLFGELLTCSDEPWMQSTNAWDYLNTIFSDNGLIQVLSAMVLCRTELRMQALSLFTYVHSIAPLIRGSWKLEGNCEMLVERMVSQIQVSGGEVHTDKDVILLEKENDRIVRAECADGTIYEAEWFVSDIHPAATSSLLSDSKVMGRAYVQGDTMEDTCGIFTLHLQIRSGRLPYFHHSKVVVEDGGCWNKAVNRTLAVGGIMISARKADKGNCVAELNILTPMQWEVVASYEGSSPKRRPKAYRDMKETVADNCMALAEKAIPGLGDMVLKRWMSTPLTHRDRNNSPHGTVFGIHHDSNAHVKVLSPRTSVPNLLLTGHNLLLHGIHGVAVAAAQTCGAVKMKEKK